MKKSLYSRVVTKWMASLALTLFGVASLGQVLGGPPTGPVDPEWTRREQGYADSAAECWRLLGEGRFEESAVAANAGLLSGGSRRFEVVNVLSLIFLNRLEDARAITTQIQGRVHRESSPLHSLVCSLVEGLSGGCTSETWTIVRTRAGEKLSEAEFGLLPISATAKNLAFTSHVLLAENLSTSPYRDSAIWSAEAALTIYPDNVMANALFGKLGWAKAVGWEGNPWEGGKPVLRDRILLQRVLVALNKSVAFYGERDSSFKAKRDIAANLLAE